MSYRTQPARVTDRIREAGAEVFAWHDRDLAALLDPSGKMRRRSQLLGTAALVALTVATLALSWRGSAWMLSMMFLGWGAYRSTWTLARWPVWTLVVAGALAMAAVNGALWLPLVLVWVGVAAFTPHTHRPGLVWASVLAALAVSAAAPVTGPWQSLSLMGAVVAALAVNQWLGVPWSVPFGKPDLSVDPGTPAIALPRSLFRKARKMARAQGRTYESPYDALTPDDAAALRKRRVGGVGERRTALILLGLKRWRGTVIAHDVQVSETSNANGDHLVIAPSGVYLIDSKMLGTIRDGADPGSVVATGSQVAHVTDRGSRDLTRTVQVTAWETREVAAHLRHPVHSLMVVHGARVPRHLAAIQPDGVAVEILSATDLIARIESAPRELTRTQMWRLAGRLRRFKAASTKAPVLVTTPLGGYGDGGGGWEARSGTVAFEPATPKEAATTTTPPPPAPLAPAPPAAAPAVAPAPAPGTAVPDAGLHPTPLPGQLVADRWDQMSLSEPEPDPPFQWRGVTPGARATVVEFTENDMHTAPVVIMSTPRKGTTGPYVWVCTPQAYAVHVQTGDKVMVSTISIDRIMLEGANS